MTCEDSTKSCWREKKESLGKFFLFIFVYIQSFWPLVVFELLKVVLYLCEKNSSEFKWSDVEISGTLCMFSLIILGSSWLINKLISKAGKISSKKIFKLTSLKENSDKYLEYFSIAVIPCMAFNFLEQKDQISIFALIVIMGFVVVKCRVFMINVMTVMGGMRLYDVELMGENGKIKTVQAVGYKNINECVDEIVEVYEISPSVYIVKEISALENRK